MEIYLRVASVVPKQDHYGHNTTITSRGLRNFLKTVTASRDNNNRNLRRVTAYTIIFNDSFDIANNPSP